MKKVLVLSLALLLVSLGTSMAQDPTVQVFFDEWFQATHLDECPPDGPGVEEGWLYVVASNFNMWMQGIEYAIDFPPELIWVLDNTGGLDIGISPLTYLGYDCVSPTFLCTGISTAWTLPLNAFSPVIVNRVLVEYDCHGCPRDNIPITVVAHPYTGDSTPIATSWPGQLVTTATGATSLICPTVPAENTTWGNIKALYN